MLVSRICMRLKRLDMHARIDVLLVILCLEKETVKTRDGDAGEQDPEFSCELTVVLFSCLGLFPPPHILQSASPR